MSDCGKETCDCGACSEEIQMVDKKDDYTEKLKTTLEDLGKILEKAKNEGVDKIGDATEYTLEQIEKWGSDFVNRVREARMAVNKATETDEADKNK